AAQYYFGRPADLLTPLEAAYLAALKPRPSDGERHRHRGYSPERGWWPERLEALLRRAVEAVELPEAGAEHYRPFVVAFPTSERVDEIPYAPIARPGTLDVVAIEPL
ncbi:MAG: transglycosylase domain-containing protein, partial [Myxococcales bacterium]|nr:transglycosylase domain-containing protein [Myxococcales bacterium]